MIVTLKKKGGGKWLSIFSANWAHLSDDAYDKSPLTLSRLTATLRLS
jgi:hypothetical protein